MNTQQGVVEPQLESVGEFLADGLRPLTEQLGKKSLIDSADGDVVRLQDTALALAAIETTIHETVSPLDTDLDQKSGELVKKRIARIAGNVLTRNVVTIVDQDGNFIDKKLKPEASREISNRIADKETVGDSLDRPEAIRALEEVKKRLTDRAEEVAEAIKRPGLVERMRTVPHRARLYLTLGGGPKKRAKNRLKLSIENAKPIEEARNNLKSITRQVNRLKRDPRNAVEQSEIWLTSHRDHLQKVETYEDLDAIRIATEFVAERGGKGIFAAPAKKQRQSNGSGGGGTTLITQTEEDPGAVESREKTYEPIEIDPKNPFSRKFDLPWIDESKPTELKAIRVVHGDAYQVLIFEGIAQGYMKDISDELISDTGRKKKFESIADSQAAIVASGVDLQRHRGVRRSASSGIYGGEVVRRNTQRRNNAERVFYVLHCLEDRPNTYAMIIIARCDKNNEDPVVARLNATSISTARARGAGTV